MVLKQSSNCINFYACSFIFESQKNNTSMGYPVAINFLPKPLVICYEDPVFFICFFNYILISHTACLFIHRKHLMVLFSQPLGNSRSRAFIHKKAHLRHFHFKGHKGGAF